MTDAEQRRLIVLRAKLRRICGHKEWSAKQEQSARAIVREIAEIEGIKPFDQILNGIQHGSRSNEGAAAGDL